MVKRTGSLIRKGRSRYTKGTREKGKISLSSYFQSFKIDSKVCLKVNSALQKGTFQAKFQGRTGIVKAKTGSCYTIALKDGKKEKLLQIHPIHLRGI